MVGARLSHARPSRHVTERVARPHRAVRLAIAAALISVREGLTMGRKILFITTDQQRYDALGCNGGRIARTPVVDGWARDGIVYRRAYNQNTVCMPARATMLTGQYVRTHGVYANGVALPVDAPSVAAHLAERAGYRTALLGKAHFEPNFDPQGKFEENARARRGDTGAWRGFERSIQATHIAAFGGRPVSHYGRWLKQHHPEHLESFAPLLDAHGGGDSGAPETKNNPIPRQWYHTDWVADRTIEFLDSLAADDDWFVWMSFPDPHHPWDPPAEELQRIPWRDLDLPPGHPGSDERVRAILAGKPAHWLAYYEGRWQNAEGGPPNFRVPRLTHDNVREINAKVHVMNELIDEACGRVMRHVAARGWDADTDVIAPPAWMQGAPLPTSDDGTRERVLCEWDSQMPSHGMHLRSVYHRDGWLLTRYEPSTDGRPNGLERLLGNMVLTPCGIHYDGSEGELYNLKEDPHQWRNLWDDPGHRSIRSDLIADLYDHLPAERDPRLPVDAPA